MFMGEFHHNLDDKGRLMMPVKFREKLQNCILSRGLDGCLFVYDLNEWSKFEEKAKALSMTKKANRQFTRMMLGSASEIELDKQGRIKVSNPLKEFANLSKECVILGVGNKLEIWDKDKWEAYYNSNIEEFEELVETMEDIDV